MHIAYVSPLPPAGSGVADYGADLLPWLGRIMRVDAYTAPEHVSYNQNRWPGVEVRAYDTFPRFRGLYDDTVFHFSCEEGAVGPYRLFERFGGTIVLHDLNLSGLFGALTFGKQQGKRFLWELWRQDGILAAARATARFARTRQMPGTHDFWMSRGVIRRGRRIIVHNRWSRDWILHTAKPQRDRVHLVHMGVPMQPEQTLEDCLDAREALGLPRESIVLGSFGTVDETKRFSVILRAFRDVSQIVPGATCIFVGSCRDEHVRQVASMGLSDRVRMIGRVEMETFYRYMWATDACVSLRHPTHGETSAPLLRLMSLAKATAVTKVAQFDELPDAVCGKISMDHEHDELVAWLLEMSRSADRRRALGQRARDYVVQHHTLEASAREYRRILEHRDSEAG